jgi:hypothetical protein
MPDESSDTTKETPSWMSSEKNPLPCPDIRRGDEAEVYAVGTRRYVQRPWTWIRGDRTEVEEA